MQAGTDGIDIVSGNLQISANLSSVAVYYHGRNLHSRFFAAMPEKAAASGGQDIKQV